MKLIIPKKYNKSFVKFKIKKVISDLLNLFVDKKKFSVLDKVFNINSGEIVNELLKNIIILEDQSNYIITFDNTVKYHGKPLGV